MCVFICVVCGVFICVVCGVFIWLCCVWCVYLAVLCVDTSMRVLELVYIFAV